MKKSFFVLLLAMVMIVLTACGQEKATDAPKETIAAAGTDSSAGNSGSGQTKTKLVLGTSADYAPYEFHKSIDGKDTIVGFDISIAKEIAKDMNAELEIADMDFDSLLLALNAGKVDMVISGMTPSEERKKSVDFSELYYLAEQGVLVKKTNAELYNKLEDLKNKKIAVQKGSIQEGIAKDIEGAKLTSLAKIPEIIMELTSGRVDAIILEKPVADQYVLTQKEIVVSGVKIEQSEDEAGAAIAIKKGNSDLVGSINKTIKRLKEDGSVDRFVVEANELVGE